MLTSQSGSQEFIMFEFSPLRSKVFLVACSAPFLCLLEIQQAGFFVIIVNTFHVNHAYL